MREWEETSYPPPPGITKEMNLLGLKPEVSLDNRSAFISGLKSGDFCVSIKRIRFESSHYWQFNKTPCWAVGIVNKKCKVKSDPFYIRYGSFLFKGGIKSKWAS